MDFVFGFRYPRENLWKDSYKTKIHFAEAENKWLTNNSLLVKELL